MRDGTIATGELKDKILEACNGESVRPMTDIVAVNDPDMVQYNIDLVYYLRRGENISAANIEAAVNRAVQSFITWQGTALGRDINPSKLIDMLMDTGIKRVEVRLPEFTELRSGVGEYWSNPALSVPQVAQIGSVTVTNGGYEDE
jgi:phage-related baseplate assembly protein